MDANTDSRFLIVDADTYSRLTFADGLRGHGYEIFEADSGACALEHLAAHRFAVMVLDPVHLGMSEDLILRRARELDQDIELIICTATPTIDSTIVAIRANVFDYLLKPCTPADLLRSVSRALDQRAKQTRRERLLSMVKQVMSELENGIGEVAPVPAAASSPNMQVPWMEWNREKRMVTLHTTPPQAVELTEGEAALLTALMEKPNQVLTCAQLAQVALGYNGMDKWTVESVIRSSIFRLRQKLEPSEDAPKLIHTLRGRGYYYSGV